MTFSANSSMSTSRRALNGRAMPTSESTGSAWPERRTSKVPLRGLEGLMVTEKPAALSRPSSLVALVLKTPQELHLSISTAPDRSVFAAPAGASFFGLAGALAACGGGLGGFG